jgi:general stress protein CsbA
MLHFRSVMFSRISHPQYVVLATACVLLPRSTIFNSTLS